MRPVVSRPLRHPVTGSVLLGAAWCALAGAVLPLAVRAQGREVVRKAIVTTCGELPDPKKAAVVAGVVMDSISHVVLPSAQVRLSWKDPDGKKKSSIATTTRAGFFAFCNVPGGVRATIEANLRVSSGPRYLRIAAGELYVQDVLLPLSTVSRPGILVGRVVDAKTREPLPGAVVRLVERNDQTVTNSHGYFSFGKKPFGIYMLDVKMIGYEEREAPVRVAGNFTQNAEIDLARRSVELEGLKVTVRPRYQRFDLDGLVRRMSLGAGSFITRDVLERRPHARITDLLRSTPGVNVYVHRDRSYTLEVRGRSCKPDVFIDGIYYMESDNALDIPAAADLEAVEIYEGAAQIPGIYLRVNLNRPPPCAVIAAWTRVHPGAGPGLPSAQDTTGK